MVKKFITYSYGSWVSAAISFFSTPIITLLIIPEEFGKAAMFSLAVNFIFQVGLLGLDQSFLRMYHEKAGDDARASLFRSCFTLSMAAAVVLSCVVLFFWRPVSAALFEGHDFSAVLVLACCLAGFAVNRYAMNIVRLSRRGHVLSAAQIAASVVHIAVTVIYAKYVAPTFHAVVWGVAASLILSSAIYFLAERRFWLRRADRAAFDRAELKKILGYGLPMIPVLIVMSLFQAMDKIALRACSSFEEIGLYAAATKFVFLLTIIQTGFYMFWNPVAFEKYEADHTSYRFFEGMFEYFAVVALGAGSALLLSKDIIALLLAPAYRSAALIMPFLILPPCMYILGDIAGIGISLKKKTYFHIVVALAGAAFNFVGNFFLVPALGGRGAAISTGAAFVVYFIIRATISRKLFPARCPIMKFVPAFLVLVAFMYVNTFHAIPWWYNVVPILTVAVLHKSIIVGMLGGVIKDFERGGGS